MLLLKQSVLVLRPDHLGDAVLFSGTLRHLRKKYRYRPIFLITQPVVKNYFQHCPYVDAVCYWDYLTEYAYKKIRPSRKCKRNPISITKKLSILIRELLALQHHDAHTVIIPVKSPYAATHALVRKLDTKFKIAVSGNYVNQTKDQESEYINQYSSLLDVSDSDTTIHELEFYKVFLRKLGIKVEVEDIWPEVWTTNSDHLWAKERIHCSSDATIMAICPGVTSIPEKFYPGYKYAEAVAKLDGLFEVYIFGESRESTQCNDVALSLRSCTNVRSIKDYCGKTTVLQLAEALKKCDLVVSQDTAALHIATALRKPTVGLVGGGDVDRFYPWGNDTINRASRKKLDCYSCGWSCIHPSIRCIQEIDPSTLANEMEAALRNANRLPV